MPNNRLRFLTLVLLLVASSPAGGTLEPSHNQSLIGAAPKVTRQTVGSGGGSSSAGGFELRGTIGQPSPGLSTAPSLSILSGFWAPPLVNQGCDGSDAIFCGNFESGGFSSWDVVVGN